MRRIHLAILGLAFGLAAGLQATACQGLTINRLTFNSGYVIQLVNNPNSVNPDAAINILTAQVTNNSGAVLTDPTVTLSVNEPANPDGCAGATVISPITLTVHKTLQPGQSVTLVASDFGGNGQASICQQFKDDINNQFQNINSSNANMAVAQFMRRRFQVVLRDVACGSQASVFISIFNPPTGSKASPAAPMLPRDQSTLTDPLPMFLWTPAVSGGSSQGVDYMLVLSLDASGSPWKVIDGLPTGQLFYKWQASDPALPLGRLYWHVVSKDHASGALLGGQGGQGWSTQFSFTVAQNGVPGNCAYSNSDLDQFVRKNAGAKAALLDGLHFEQVLPAEGSAGVSAGLSDPDVCALLGLAGGSAPGKVHLLNLTVTRR